MLLLLAAACTAPSPTPQEPPDDTGEAPAPVEGDGTLFNRDSIGAIDLQLTDAASATLASDEGTTTWVETGVQLALGGQPITLDRVGVQVKGSATFVAWPGKSSLKVKLDAFVPGQDVDGVERIALHNLVTDRSFLRESMAWWAFRELGSPAARASHVTLLANGAADWEPNNLYVMVEAINGDFLEQWFGDASGPMWEGIAGGLEAPGALWCDRGDCTDTANLDALADAITNAPEETFVQDVGAYLDWEAWLRYWATEAMVQQMDGFTTANRNFRVYWEPTIGRFYLIPWSLDSTFEQTGTIAIMPDNLLVTRCLSITACRDDFHDALLAAADAWEEADAVAEIDRAQALLEATGFADEVSTAEYETLRTIMGDRPAAARRYVEENGD